MTGPTPFTLDRRSCGVLLHPTSLPGLYGSGDLGSSASPFAEFLRDAGQRWWQMLPVGPAGPGDSPYSSTSAFAGSDLLIDLEGLVSAGLLKRDELKPPRGGSVSRVRFGAVGRYREARLRRAFARFQSGGVDRRYRRFINQHSGWLKDYALFQALKRAHRGAAWTEWKPALRRRDTEALRRARELHEEEIEYAYFTQYWFDRQWFELKRFCNGIGVGLIGDIPIYVGQDSADVWANQELFRLDRRGRPTLLSGAPPDPSCPGGQTWGHPLYRWGRHERSGFAWWVARFRRMIECFDAVRLDHFLGFHRCWAVEPGAKDAKGGRWMRSPGGKLFDAVHSELGAMQVVAEDLGVVTPAAEALRDRLGYRGMRIWQCGFGGSFEDGNLPHSYPRECVAYSGTHDNETVMGWFRGLDAGDPLVSLGNVLRTKQSSGDGDRKREFEPGWPRLSTRGRVLRYLGGNGKQLHWDAIRQLYLSQADTVITPMQDILGLDNRARMNRPGTARGNWGWRMSERVLEAPLSEKLRGLAEAFGRIVR